MIAVLFQPKVLKSPMWQKDNRRGPLLDFPFSLVGVTGMTPVFFMWEIGFMF